MSKLLVPPACVTAASCQRDLVIVGWVLVYTNEIEKSIKELIRVTKNNGIISICSSHGKKIRKVFSEDYMILRTQTYNNQMGFVQKDNVKLLGEDKMVQYFWDWFASSNTKDSPWEIHPTNSDTNTVHQDISMLYPPANIDRDIKNKRSIAINLAIRILVPIGITLLIII